MPHQIKVQRLHVSTILQPLRLSLAKSLLLATLTFPSTVWADCAIRWAPSSNTVYIESPITCTLTDIYNIAAPKDYTILDKITPPQGSTVQTWLLKANLKLTNGATLVVKGSSLGGDTDELRLLSNNASASNSYVSLIASWGNVLVDTVSILSWDTKANGGLGDVDTQYQNGRAYMGVQSTLATDGITPLISRMDIKNSDIGYLGFPGAESYGLSWKVISPTTSYSTVDVLGDVINNVIHDNYYGLYTYASGGQCLTCLNGTGMNIINNEIYNSARYAITSYSDSDYLFVDSNRIHDNGYYGISSSVNSDHLTLTNNQIYRNGGTGIAFSKNITNSVVTGNDIENNQGSGISLSESFSNTFENNTIIGNQYGVRLTTGSSDNVIKGNQVGDSRKYGLYAFKSNQPPTLSDGLMRRNVFQSNTVYGSGDAPVSFSDFAGDNINGLPCSQASTTRQAAKSCNRLIKNNFSPSGLPANALDTLILKNGDGYLLSNNQFTSTTSLQLIGTASQATVVQVNKQKLLTLVLDSFSSATYFDRKGQIYYPETAAVPTTVTAVGSQLTLNRNNIGPSSTIELQPLGAKVTAQNSVVIDTASLLIDFPKTWTATALSATQPVTYTVGGLTSGTTYTIKKNGLVLNTFTARSTQGTFSDVPATTQSVIYEVNP